ncbi:MAG: C1 family peptidase [Marinilabiliaceae bacterium]|nr:C1 family peptidase [Marinilabiliaceae bacterium]
MKYLKLFYLLILVMSITSCDEIADAIEEELNKIETPEPTGLDTEKEEKLNKTTPKDLSIVTLSNSDVQLDSKVSLRSFMPPIGDQGQYGTCTSWATGYYTRTMMQAHEKELSSADLTNDNNVFSPLDIYLSISHGPDCGGSSIAEAFKTMQTRGIAKMSDVPYENLGSCSQSSSASPAQYQSGKIDHFRSVDVTKVDELKTLLQRGCPIAVGCKLSEDFFSYKSGVIEDLDYTSYNAQNKHAGHAMCIVGYDDHKGADGAFCLANSWGERWGDNGFLWVAYDFFTAGEFCKYGYTIEADKGTPPVIDQNVINPSVRVDGKDLLSIVLIDRPGDTHDDNPNPGPRDRSVQYNVFNKGKEAIPASDDWNIIYYYYNAVDPQEDFGIVFYDYYTDDVSGVADKGENGDIAKLNNSMTTYGIWNWWNYIDVPAGYSAGKALDDGNESDMVMDYTLPADLNGEYYFVLFADGFNTLNEKHEQNNYLFFTGSDRKPIKITNGVVDQNSLKGASVSSAYVNELQASQPNAYTPEEIAGLINFQKEEGILQERAMRFRSQLKSSSRKKAVKRFVPSRISGECE